MESVCDSGGESGQKVSSPAARRRARLEGQRKLRRGGRPHARDGAGRLPLDQGRADQEQPGCGAGEATKIRFYLVTAAFARSCPSYKTKTKHL